jgi:plastocyanin
MLAYNIITLAALVGLAAAQYGSSPSSSSSSSASPSTTASSNVHAVTVGSGGGLVFSPDTITAAKGDIVEFHFNPLNHSVVEGDFATPCKPKSGGFFSGFVPLSTGTSPNVFAVTINDTQPIFFYCAQTAFTHCQSGMVGVINPGYVSQSMQCFTKS